MMMMTSGVTRSRGVWHLLLRAARCRCCCCCADVVLTVRSRESNGLFVMTQYFVVRIARRIAVAGVSLVVVRREQFAGVRLLFSFGEDVRQRRTRTKTKCFVEVQEEYEQ